MIRFQQVAKRFRKFQALKGIDLDIPSGSRLALVGSNGAGKTTLIRCLLGEYHFEGSISIDGQDVHAQRTEVLKQVGFVPQLPPPLKMPVGQLIHFAADVCDADPGRMEAMARRLGLDLELLRKRPFVRLSGGQKQKILISIALGRDSRLLIMDEPAANLDPEARHIFFQLLAEKPEETVMLISSHRLDEVASLVNRVVEMDQGQVVLDDRVADRVDLDSQLRCELRINREEPAFARSLAQWGFQPAGGLCWTGLVAGADRLRFLGVLSRYAGLLSAIRMEETGEETA
ncbi:ABC transporter ATP-binding protein [Thiohalobacter sp. IOR34]|uniref:ABC transporter ATP-binding protein n=1 Tax=Thiohalobacter sp. IOR34 TaxID=3057176 RepID=UPI0025B03174|nr:ABC transporter ATP-binding protein [Thiohalobacter sp. IOR34]WJW75961.1 ABC transporter ATP-binding protein [Thiohalobacter sp. IOR34]